MEDPSQYYFGFDPGSGVFPSGTHGPSHLEEGGGCPPTPGPAMSPAPSTPATPFQLASLMSPETLNLNMLNSVYSPSPSPYSPGEEDMDLEDTEIGYTNMLPLPVTRELEQEDGTVGQANAVETAMDENWVVRNLHHSNSTAYDEVCKVIDSSEDLLLSVDPETICPRSSVTVSQESENSSDNDASSSSTSPSVAEFQAFDWDSMSIPNFVFKEAYKQGQDQGPPAVGIKQYRAAAKVLLVNLFSPADLMNRSFTGKKAARNPHGPDENTGLCHIKILAIQRLLAMMGKGWENGLTAEQCIPKADEWLTRENCLLTPEVGNEIRKKVFTDDRSQIAGALRKRRAYDGVQRFCPDGCRVDEENEKITLATGAHPLLMSKTELASVFLERKEFQFDPLNAVVNPKIVRRVGNAIYAVMYKGDATRSLSGKGKNKNVVLMPLDRTKMEVFYELVYRVLCTDYGRCPYVFHVVENGDDFTSSAPESLKSFLKHHCLVNKGSQMRAQAIKKAAARAGPPPFHCPGDVAPTKVQITN